MRTPSVVLLFVLLIALVAGGVYYFRDTDGPEISLTPASGPVSSRKPLQLTLTDQASGLKQVDVLLVQGSKQIALYSQELPPGSYQHRQQLSLAGIKLNNGPLEIRVTAGDRSIYHFGQGNTGNRSFILEFDSKPPRISVLSRSHNLNQGGSGLIIFKVNETVTRTGVQIDDLFFPAYQQEDGSYACLFAAPYDLSPKKLVPRLSAEDLAGNQRRSGFYHHINARALHKAKINISNRFLEAKMPDFQQYFPETADLLQIFIRVNRELRQQNRARLQEFVAQTEPKPLWEGAFLRPKGTNREPFATARTYYHNGRKIDRQVHLGVDIASVARGPVVAANSGRVVLAEEFGIYGQCIIIDHGLGLMSLYGHLSNIEVAAGDLVKKGQEIARTGATGLAGGDHLHFGLILNGLPVNPVEWWDRNWVRNNIDKKLSLIAAP
ncbi:M23 family metallopeptidase [Geothermobacter hydrogeniphilus]|uniref:M23 family metallopeptidase n=1 Tax=Geothermobacter hydrogeniphilus TaxID=1969733 RepID=UPI001E5D77CF|nr:M23 family metallopeptidase [Geothermobacter hydrogeniphilus]